MENLIKNFKELATTPLRKDALTVAEAAFQSIDTEKVILNSFKIEGDTLCIGGKQFNLSKFKNIKVVGFGKSSCKGAMALERILGSRINGGAVISVNKVAMEYIESFTGTHPRPSTQNLEAGDKIYNIAKNSGEDDLVIAVVSGGGSALLCYGEEECKAEIALYDTSIKAGENISEMNTVRKHLSVLKGGGLAKIAYPATVIGLIFSDIPGTHFEDVASGPTYRDMTTVSEARKITEKYNLGDFKFTETPKEEKYFEKVHNFVLVSNTTAAEAMSKKSKELGYRSKLISTELYDEADTVAKKIFEHAENSTAIIAAGEPKVKVPEHPGLGGRCAHMALFVARENLLDDKSLFIALASDGIDNSDAAGALVDQALIDKAKSLGLDAGDFFSRFDSYNYFKSSGGLLFTGPTGANVSDLFILLTEK